MLIECTVRRAGGSTVEYLGTEYHFAPARDGGPHVCEVTEPETIERLLSITDTYRIARDGAPEVRPEVTVIPVAVTDANGSTTRVEDMDKDALLEYGRMLGLRLDARMGVDRLRQNVLLKLQEMGEE